MQNTICGKANAAQSTQELRTTLDHMMARSGCGNPDQSQTAIQRSFGVATYSDNGYAQVVQSAQCIVSFAGRPHWRNDALELVEEKRGFMHSLIVAYQEHGPELLQFLRGSFAIAIADVGSDSLFLAIDRMATCSMYYSSNAGNELAFATRATSLVDGTSPQLSAQSVYDYLYFHMIPSPGTIFRNQQKLGAGERLIHKNGTTTVDKYWSPTFSSTTKHSRAELEHELMDILRRTIRRSVRSSKCGSFLSGGIDSSTIAGLFKEVDTNAKTFTIGFKEEGYDETAYARVTAKHFDTSQHEFLVSPQDVVDILPKIAQSYDEPFGNSSVVPTYYCARLAKEHNIELLLAGDGGDELFGGNVRYVMQSIFGIYDRTPSWIRTSLIEPLAFGVPGANKFFPTQKLQSYIKQAKVPMPDRLQTYNYFSRTPVEDILHGDLLERINKEEPLQQLRESYNGSTADSMLNKMLELDWKFTLADNDIRKVSHMCGLAGVEVDYPFLDDELVAFSATIPPNMKIRHFRLRHFFKHAVRHFLPTETLKKSKHGFGLPFGIWMKSYQPLKDLAYDSLSDLRKRRIVRDDYLDQLLESHNSVHAHYYGEFIWVLMMLELWLTTHKQELS